MATARDIFQMLREGRVDEALTTARTLYTQEPDNVWNLRALIRALCKSIWEADSPGRAQQSAAELSALPQLPAGDDDASLTEYRERSIRRADPLSQRLWAIREQSKNGDHRGALRQLRALHRAHPDRADIDESLAWEIWHALVDALRQDEPDKGQVRNLLLEYRNLQVEKPSVIHSRILDVAARAAHNGAFPSFCRFLIWWDPANLRNEDFQGTAGNDGSSFPSAVERTIQGVGKALKKEAHADAVRAAAEFVEAHYGRYPDQEWFPYYMAIALIRSGRTEEARDLLVPTVRKKQSQSWAWHHLAECFEAGEPARLACLCKAVLCGAPEPQHLLPVRLDLATELRTAGHPDAAKHEIDTVVQVRTDHGWAIKGDLLDITRSEWFQEATARDAQDDYRKWADKADEILTQGLPWHDAVLGVLDVTIGKRKDRFGIVDVSVEPGEVVSMPVKMKAFPRVSQMPVGSQLAVQLDDTSEKPFIIGLRSRDGEPWDIVEKAPALVARVNCQKGVTVLLAEDGTECFCYHNDVPDGSSLTPGAVVLSSIVRDSRRTKVRHLAPFDGEAASSHWREYSGTFRPRDRGGGHVEDVFVHARLSSGFQGGCVVRGMAVRRSDEESRRSWWDAVSAKAEDEDRA